MAVDFSVINGYNKDNNFSDVKFGNGAPLLETELNEMQIIQREARADLVRDTIPSGFVKLGDLDYTTMSTSPNLVKTLTESIAYVNGYKIVVPLGTSIVLKELKDDVISTFRVTPNSNDYRGVCYGNGLFVAVSISGVGNRVMTSPDGINWTSRTSTADNLWNSVCYGNGLFVAVASSGTGNRVMTSPDGINWTSRTSASDNDWRNVVYSNGLFVAVASSGTGNRVMTSPDGINWTSRTSASDNSWYGLCYGNGLFVAVSITGTGNRIMTSPDGITWTSRVNPVNNDWLGVCYGNGLFVAVAQTGTGNRIMTSPDGITWTSRVNPIDSGWKSVAYGDGLFVAVNETSTGNRVMTSPDGITWTLRKTSIYDSNWYRICYGNNMFVVVSVGVTESRAMTIVRNNSVPREDLIFLEMWFEEKTNMDTIYKGGHDLDSSTITNNIQDSRIGSETSRRTQLKWRLRVADNADFTNNTLDGFAVSGGWYNTATLIAVTPQGGNTLPLVFDVTSSATRVRTAYRNSIARDTGMPTTYLYNDYGLYISGIGSDIDKSTLKTADGYCYAIPMYQVHRRPSCGQLETNEYNLFHPLSRGSELANFDSALRLSTCSPSIRKSYFTKDLFNLETDGCCENTAPFSNVNCNVSLDTVNVANGKNSIKLTSSATGTFTSTLPARTVNPTGYYFIAGHIKNISATSISIKALKGSNSNVMATTENITSTSAFTRVGIKLSPTDLAGETSIKIQAMGTGTAGSQVVNIDSIRLLEISQDDYNLGLPELLLKYPYFTLNLLGSVGDCEDYTRLISYGSSSTLYNDATTKVFGTQSIKSISNASYIYSGVAHDSTRLVDTSKYYLLSAYVKNSMILNGATNTISLSCTSGTIVSSTIPTTMDWTRIAIRIKPSDFIGKNVTAVYSNIITTDSTKNTNLILNVDGMCLREISAEDYILPSNSSGTTTWATSPNLIVNPTLATDANSDGVSDGWTYVDNFYDGTNTKSIDNGQKITVSGGTNTLEPHILQNIPASINNTIIVSVQAQVTGDVTAVLRVSSGDSSNEISTPINVVGTTSDVYTTLTTTIVSSSVNTNKAIIKLRCVPNQIGSSGSVWFKDVVVNVIDTSIRQQQLLDYIPYKGLMNKYPFNGYSFDYAGAGNFEMKMYGNTYTNILGNDGNCESLTPWTSLSASSTTLDSSNKIFGSYSIKPNNSTEFWAGITKNITNVMSTAKYHMLSCYVKSDGLSATGCNVTLWDGDYAIIVSSSPIKPSVWTRICVKVQPSDFAGKNTSGLRILIQNGATVGSNVFYVDGVMLNEISQEDYNSLSTSQLISKYPYIAGTRSVEKQRIKSTGKNLIDVSSSTSGVNSSIVLDSTGVTVTATSEVAYAGLSIYLPTLKPNTQYCISMISTNVSGSHVGLSDIYANGVWYAGLTSASGYRSATFTTPPYPAKLKVNLYATGSVAEIASVKYSNIQLEEGSMATLYEPYQSSFITVPYDLKSVIDMRDEIDILNGTLTKNISDWKQLDGSLSYYINTDNSGFKSIYTIDTINNVMISTPVKVIKYNGSQLTFGTYSVTSDRAQIDVNYRILMSVSDLDTGWDDTWTAGTSFTGLTWGNLIKAYMNGWKLTTVNTNVASCVWTGISSATTQSGSSGLTYCISNINAGFTPYKMIYQLANPIVTNISNEIKGKLFITANTYTFSHEEFIPITVTPTSSGGNTSFTTPTGTTILGIVRNGIDDLTRKFTVSGNSASIADASYLAGTYTAYYQYDYDIAPPSVELKLDSGSVPTQAVNVYSVTINGFDLWNKKQLDGSYNFKPLNSVSNGNFSDGINGLSSLYCSSIAYNNTLQIIGNGTGDQPRTAMISNINYITNRRVYVRAKVRVTNSSCYSIMLRTYGVTTNGSIQSINQANPVQNQVYTLQGIMTMPSDGSGRVGFQFQHSYVDSATSLGKVLEVQEAMIIDMGFDSTNPLYNKSVSDMSSLYPRWIDSKDTNSRNDSLYANLVNAKDTIDLRHKVSLTGFDYYQTLEDNFDRLIRGDLDTKIKKQLLKTYHGLQRPPIDENTIFYASLNGTTTAEIGGAPSTGNATIFRKSPTGLSAKPNNLGYNIDFSTYNTITIDMCMYIDDVTLNENINMVLYSAVAGGGTWIAVFGKTYANTIACTVASYVATDSLISKSWNHIRIGFNNTTKIGFIYVNGIRRSMNNTSSVDISSSRSILITDGSANGTSLYSNIVISKDYKDYPPEYINKNAWTSLNMLQSPFTEQQAIKSDALMSLSEISICKALSSAQSANSLGIARVTIGNANVWTANDTITVKGAQGEIIAGIIDTDTALAYILEGVTAGTTVRLDDVSKLVVNDTFKVVTNGIPTAEITITSIDTTLKTITWSGNQTFVVGAYLVETTTATSIPTIRFNLSGTAQAGASTTITLASGSNGTDSTYNTLSIYITGGTGIGQIRTISSYVGATKVATISSAWTTNPDSTSTYTIMGVTQTCTWSGIGTNVATATLGTLSTLLTNQDLYINYSVNTPVGNRALQEVCTTTLAGEVNSTKLIPYTTDYTITDDFKGKSAGDLSICPHIIKAQNSSSILSVKDFTTELTTSDYINIEKSYDGKTFTQSTSVNGERPQILVGINLIRMFEDKFGVISAVDKIAWLKSNLALVNSYYYKFTVTAKSNNPTSSVLNYAFHAWDATSPSTVIPSTFYVTLNSSSLLSRISSDGYFYLTIYPENNSDGITPSVITLDSISFEMNVRATSTGFDVLAPENTRRDAGRSNILQIRKENKEVRTLYPVLPTDSVVTYMDYLPYQGIFGASYSYVAIRDKLLVTTAGTGAVSNCLYRKVMSHMLPRLVDDSLLFQERPVTTGITDANVTNHRNSPIVEIYQNHNPAHSIGATYNTLPSAYALDLDKSMSHLTVLCGLVSTSNGELLLRVRASYQADKSVTTTSQVNTSSYDYKLNGRLLIKSQ